MVTIWRADSDNKELKTEWVKDDKKYICKISNLLTCFVLNIYKEGITDKGDKYLELILNDKDNRSKNLILKVDEFKNEKH